MSLIRKIPLFVVPLIIYNIVAQSGAAGTSGGLGAVVFQLNLASGAAMVATIADVLLLLGVFVLYIEIFKATRTSADAIIDHALSMLVFVGFLIEFLMVESAGTTTFLILTLMALMDVIAGFTVSISTARRDLSVGGG